MKKSRITIFTLTAGLALMAAAPAFSRVNVAFNVGVGGYGYYPPPVYYAQPPVYYAPPPVVYAPAPVYTQPAYVQPAYPPAVYVQPARYGAPVYVYDRPVRYWHGPYHGYQRGYRAYPDYDRPR
jgi:hypothetical protein